MHKRDSNQLGLFNLCRSVFICGSFLLVFSTGGAALAQGGGKAEPNRIEFKRGTHSTTISGTVRGDEQAEYVLSAKKGQRLVIKLTSAPLKSSVFQLLGEPAERRLQAEWKTIRWDWSTTPTMITQACCRRLVTISSV